MKKLFFLLQKLPYKVTIVKNIINIKNDLGWVIKISQEKGTKTIINFNLTHDEAEINSFKTLLKNREKIVEIVSLYLGLYDTTLSISNPVKKLVSSKKDQLIFCNLTSYVIILFQIDNIKEKIKKIAI